LYSQQAFERMIQSSFELEGYSIASTFDNGMVVTGTRPGGILLIKLDSLGNVEWDKKIENIFWGNGTGIKIIQTHDGNFLVAGHINTGTDIAEIFFLKTDTLGNLIWLRIIKEF